jgi:hypothetical protein
MLDNRKDCGRLSGYPLCGGVGRDQVRMLGFEPFELVEQRVELFVRDLRLIENVVAVFVVPDLLAELLKAGQDVHELERELTGGISPARDHRSLAST